MKRFLTISCLFLLVVSISFAQNDNDIAISLTGGLTFPSGDFGDVYGTGLGFKGVFHYILNPAISVTGTTGFLRWSDSITFLGESLETSVSSIPILGGLRFFFSPGEISPYAQGEIGFHILTSKVSGFGESSSESDIEFGYGVGAGVLYELNPNISFDANIKFNSMSGEGGTSGNFLSLFVGIYIPF